MYMEEKLLILKDRIRGVLFGQAIGDALGVGTEFMSKKEVNIRYPNGLSSYCQINPKIYPDNLGPGSWSDDTDMMLCIADAIIKDRDICMNTIANNFKKWFRGNPFGIGMHTYNLLSSPAYVDNPIGVAEVLWEQSGRNNAANGAIMRTSIIGLWTQNVPYYAETVCKLTHADPRCIGSCVIISELINNFVWSGKELDFDTMTKIANKYDNRIEPYLVLAKSSNDISYLELDDEPAIGYTLKALAAAVWCLYHTNSFTDGLLAVVNAGGDADTNAAVACSLLGAKYGYSHIPKYYIDELRNAKRLEDVSEKLFELLK